MSGVAEISLVKVSDCCEILDSHRIPLNSEERDKIPGDVPYYGANGVQGYISKHLFDEDLILIAEDGGNFDQYADRSIAYRISGKSWVNNHAHILRARSDYDQNFVFYSLEHKNICSVIKGGTRSKLNQSELREITIWDAPRRDQQKIAHILTTVDNLIEKTQALIDKYTAVKQGMMHDLFTRGIDLATGQLRPSYEQAPELYKETELGRVPREWGVVRVMEVARVVDSLHQTPVFQNDGFPMVRVTDIKGGAINFSGCEKVSSEVYAKFTEAYKPKRNDIVLSRVGSYGISSFSNSDVPFCMGQNTVVITSNLNMYFFYEMLQTQIVKGQFDLSVAGSSQKTLSLRSIKHTFVPVPLVGEQSEISKRLSAISEVLKDEETCLDKYLLHKKGLMQDLLTGRVRVEQEAVNVN